MDCMKNRHLHRGIGILMAVMAMVFVSCADAPAQWAGMDINSIIPIRSLQPYLGEVFNVTNWGNSFRSEFGLRFSVAEVQNAKLTGSRAGMLDLSPDFDFSRTDSLGLDNLFAPYINNMPVRLDAYATLRVWRLALRANYADFKNPANLSTRGYIDCGGLSVGGDFDIVQREWLLIGLCADAYFKDPVFNGYVPAHLEIVSVAPLVINRPDFFNGEVRGTRPITVGYYGRYVPPEILGMPMYLESFLNYPVKGAYYANIGVAWVFRPQIYRFDILARLRYQRVNLGFDQDLASTVGPPVNREYQNWKLEAAWNVYGLEFGMYF
jgi:hypothetical protein